MRLGYKGILRAGEAGGLRSGRVNLPRGPLGVGHAAIIVIDSPKTARDLGRQQFSMVYERWVIAWLAWLLEGLPTDLLLLPGGLATLRWAMGYIGTMIGISALSLTPASLRAGGATEHVQKLRNVPPSCISAAGGSFALLSTTFKRR